MIRPLLIVLGSAIALAGCASLPAHPGSETAAALSSSTCPRGAEQIGPNACRPFERRYSGRQLRETGQTNLADALKMLDPSVSTGGP